MRSRSSYNGDCLNNRLNYPDLKLWPYLDVLLHSEDQYQFIQDRARTCFVPFSCFFRLRYLNYDNTNLSKLYNEHKY